MTKSEIDRLGDRFRSGRPEDANLRLLEDYRRSFADAYEDVVRLIRQEMGLEPTGRPAKSTTSIIEKLRRESIRLSQVQDIAGCRMIVSDTVAQKEGVAQLARAFPCTEVFDRCIRPSHGYRAVHVIVTTRGKRVEVQVRTALQHLWAELSEKLADVVDPAIKYGGGPATKRRALQLVSEVVATYEGQEQSVLDLHQNSQSQTQPRAELIKLHSVLRDVREAIARAILTLIENPDRI